MCGWNYNSGSVGEKAKEDIKNASLFASLASTSKYSVFTDPEKWYKQYFENIQVLGFSLQAENFSALNMDSKSMQVDEIILEILTGLLTEGESIIIEQAINYIRSLGKPQNFTTV